MPAPEVRVFIKSNNPDIEAAFLAHKNNSEIKFTNKDNHLPYKIVLIDLHDDLSKISHEIIDLYKSTKDDKAKLAVALLFHENIDSERKHYFQNLLDSLGQNAPLHRLILVKDLYTEGSEIATPLDQRLSEVLSQNSISISKKGENTYYPLSLSDFINAINKTLFLSNTAGATFWTLGDPISDLEMSYLLKRLGSDRGDLEINAIKPDLPELKTLQTQGNKTRAEINWQPENDFFQDLKEKASLVNLQATPTISQRVKLNPFQKLILWVYRSRSPKKDSLPTLKRLTSTLLKTLAVGAILLILSTSISTGLSLLHLEKSLNLILKGSFAKSQWHLQQSVYYKEIGESLFSAFLPVGNLVAPKETEKWYNLYSFIDYSTTSLNNIHQTYTLGDNFLASLKNQSSTIKISDLSLGLYSNLSQIYENLNQTAFLTKKNKLPAIIENTLQKSQEYQNLSNLGDQVSQYLKVTSLLPVIFADDGERTLLVLLQNNQSLQPSGGRVEDYFVIKLNQGKLASTQHYQEGDLDNFYLKNSTPSAKSKRLLSTSAITLKEITSNPDFKDLSTSLSAYVEKALNVKPDTILAVNNLLFESLLREENSPDLARYTSKLREASSSAIFKDLSDTYLVKLFNHELSLPIIGRTTAKMFQENQVYLWSSDKNLEQLILPQPFSGIITQHACNVSLMQNGRCVSETSFLAESVPTNQKNNWTARTTDHSIKLLAGTIEHQYQINYSYPDIADGVSFQTTLHLYLSSPSNLDQLLINNLPASIKESQKTTHNQLDHYKIPLTITKTADLIIQIKATTQSQTLQNPPYSYSLTEYRQPGTEDKGIDLSLNYPENLKPSVVTNTITQESQTVRLTLPPRTATFGLVLTPASQ